jgi:hypothetical protein
MQVFWHYCSWVNITGWLRDIYDGSVWKSWSATANPHAPGYMRFQKNVFDCGLTLNLDGFQAFKKTAYR